MMDVVNNRDYGCSGGEVPIIPWPLLPKAKDSLVWALLHGELLEQRKVMLSQILLNAIRERPLDREKELLNSCSRGRGKDQQVDVLGHIDKGQQPKAVVDQCAVDTLREQATHRLLSQQGETVKARKGQFMAMTKIVEVPHPFTVRS
jgi:hypothetical protein